MVKFWKKYPENEPENENVLCLFKDKKTVCIGFNHIKFARALLGSETIDKEVVAFCYIDDIIALINPNPEAKELLERGKELPIYSSILNINTDNFKVVQDYIKDCQTLIEKIGGAK